MIFDIRVRPAELQGQFPEELKGFRDVFKSAEEEVLAYQGQLSTWMQKMHNAGITKALVVAAPWAQDADRRVAEFVSNYPETFVGAIELGGLRGAKALQEIETCVREYGLKCLCLRPFVDRVYADDKSLYPLYAKCAELKIAVSIVLGIVYASGPVLKYSQPIYLDSVAADFPDLRIIATHTGWPWAAEMVAIALKNHNVYIDISGVGPRYIAMPGAGYEPIFQFGKSILQDKIVWGTDWPLIDWEKSLSQIDELPLKESVKRKWLYDNAVAALALEG